MDEIKMALGLDGAADAGDVLLAVVDLVQGEACVLAELERVQEAVLAARVAVADVFVEVLEGCGVLDDPEALRAARAMYMVNPDAVAVALLGDVDFVAAARRKDGKRHPDGRLCRAKVRSCPLAFPRKGTTREGRGKSEKVRRYQVDPHDSLHKQVERLSAAIAEANKDGVRLEAVIQHPEFGELLLECGNSSPTHPSKKEAQGHGAHGVKHALEARHNVSAKDIAETLLNGSVRQHPTNGSRLYVEYGDTLLVLEREMRKGSGRISQTRAKLHTAMSQA